ncbi:MAG: aminoglycoside phosphotransferase family protein [Deltaproteobacteria bacterium]|nr:MAG: aminoglycoside phosphotransferase family protein [Deltaproteobacteria bacterium]
MTSKQPIDPVLAKSLLDTQFPEWSDLPFVPVASAGTDHDLFRVGDDKLVRLPRADWTAKQVEKEQRWLPFLAPHLPLHVPVPLAKGQPTDAFARPWSVYTWLEGENAILAPLRDLEQAALQLASFLKVLQGVDASQGPPAGAHNFSRGVPLCERDELVHNAIHELGDRVDSQAVTRLWKQAVHAPVWEGPSVWIHGDIHAGNLLTLKGSLHAVIDFGGLSVGDPACDLIVAWNLLSSNSRRVFREAINVDNATWLRGKGWALSIALIALPYYYDTNPTIVANSRRVLTELLAE